VNDVDSVPSKKPVDILAKYYTEGGQYLGICRKESNGKYYVFIDARVSDFPNTAAFTKRQRIRDAAIHLRKINPFDTFEEAESHLKNGFMGLNKLCEQETEYNGIKVVIIKRERMDNKPPFSD
jgi:hypothetical protein